MSPTFDLSVIGRSNELDGEPDQLDRMVKVFRTNATAISDATHSIKMLTQQGNEMESKAFAALGDKAREIDDGMQKTALRYRLMATAVGEFSSVLREEQSSARQRLEHARQAERDYARAEADHRTAQGWATSVDEPVRQQGIELNRSAVARSHAASASLQSHRAALTSAVDRVNEANRRASDKVKNAMETSGLDDSLLDKIIDRGKKVLDAVAAVGKWIWDNLETIALVVQIISWVAMFIPVVGPIIAAGAKALTVALRVALKVKKGLQTVKTVWSVGQDVVSGNYSGAAKKVLTLGASYVAGKVIGKASKAVSKAAGSAVATKMYSLGPDGSLHSTAAGRQIHEVVMKYGPAMIQPGQPLPGDFASMHINRTTEIIEKGTAVVVDKVIKPSLKSHYNQEIKPTVDRAIQGVSDLLKPLDAGRCYVSVGGPSSPDLRFSGGGGGGGGVGGR